MYIRIDALKLAVFALVVVHVLVVVALAIWYVSVTRNRNLPIYTHCTRESHMDDTNMHLPVRPPPREIPPACEANEEFYSSPLFCHSTKKPLLLVLILSYVGNFQRRQEARTGWMRSRFHMKPDFIEAHLWSYTFVVGRLVGDRAAEMEKFVTVEKCLYKDILYVDVVENYSNLTRKKMEALEYLINWGLDFDVVLKTDDDTFINMQLILEWLPDGMSHACWNGNCSTVLLYGGSCTYTAEAIRNPNSKWYLSKQEYANSRLPPFCYGTAYFLSKDMIKAMLELPDLKKSFKLEDVHTGLLVKETRLVSAGHMVHTSRINRYDTYPCKQDHQHAFAVTASTSWLRTRHWKSFMRNIHCP